MVTISPLLTMNQRRRKMAQAGHLRQVRAHNPGTGASARRRGGQRPRCPAPTLPGRPLRPRPGGRAKPAAPRAWRGGGGFPGTRMAPPPPFSLCCTYARTTGHAAATPRSGRASAGGSHDIVRPHPREHCSLPANPVKLGIRTLSSRPRTYVATTARDRRHRGPRGECKCGCPPLRRPPRALPGSGGPPLPPPPAPVPSPLPPLPPSPGPTAGALPAPPSGSASAPRPYGQPESEPRGGLRSVRRDGSSRRRLGQSRLAPARHSPEAPLADADPAGPG